MIYMQCLRAEGTREFSGRDDDCSIGMSPLLLGSFSRSGKVCLHDFLIMLTIC